MSKKVPVVEKILGANESLAEENRAKLDEHGVFGINLMASPGAGKTSVIEQTLPKLAERYRIAVIDGSRRRYCRTSQHWRKLPSRCNYAQKRHGRD